MDKKILKPVFIGGVERSGTTLLGSLLGTQKGCVTTPESQFKTNLLFTEDFDKTVVIKSIKKDFRFKIWDIHLDNIDHIIQKNAESLMNDLIMKYNKRNLNKEDPSIWVDHTPNNFKYAKELLKVYPNAKFVQIIRDPRATISSILKTDWGIVDVLAGINFWKYRMLDIILIKEHLINKNAYYEIKYEDLILNPKIELKNICSFLNIEFNPTLVHNRGFILPAYTKKQHSNVNKKLVKNNINKWKNRLTKKEIKYIEYVTEEFMNQHGYKLSSPLKQIDGLFKRKYFKYIMKKIIFHLMLKFRQKYYVS